MTCSNFAFTVRPFKASVLGIEKKGSDFFNKVMNSVGRKPVIAKKILE